MLVTGLVMTSVFLAVCIVAPVLAPYGFSQMRGVDGVAFGVLEPPSAVHPWGTTSGGLDVFSRAMWGARTALFVILLGVFIPLVIGVPLGVIAGYLKGPLDRVLTMIADTLYAFPTLLLAIVVSLIVSGGRSGVVSGVVSAAISLSVVYIPQYYRVVRAEASRVSSEGYVESAKTMGASTGWLIRHAVFGNSLRSVPLIMTLNAGDAVMTLASLGFLGFGIEPSFAAEWGYDLNRAMNDVTNSVWWTAVFPGMMIVIVVLGFTLLGEALNDVSDPRYRMSLPVKKILERTGRTDLLQEINQSMCPVMSASSDLGVENGGSSGSTGVSKGGGRP